VERIGHAVPFIKAYLTDSRPAALDGECVVIAFDPEFSEDIQRVDVPRNRQTIGKIVGRALGFDMLAVQFRVAAPGEWDQLSQAPDDPGSAEEEAGPLPAKRTAQHWYGDEHVQKVIDLFQGEIEDVRE